MYGKIFESIYDGTLVDNWEALITFQQMIILCDSEGVIDMTASAISRRTGIPLEHITEGIKYLEKEDPGSRTPNENGKRIVRIDDHRDWGWRIVNHRYYKKLASYEDKKRVDRERIAKKRLEINNVSSCRSVSQEVANVAHTNTNTNTDTNIIIKEKINKSKLKTKSLIPNDFKIDESMLEWFNNENFQYIEIKSATDEFIDYWKSKGGMKKDWIATWRNGMRLKEKWEKNSGHKKITNTSITPKPFVPVYGDEK
jgi:hypothetical protein